MMGFMTAGTAQMKVAVVSFRKSLHIYFNCYKALLINSQKYHFISY